MLMHCQYRDSRPICESNFEHHKVFVEVSNRFNIRPTGMLLKKKTDGKYPPLLKNCCPDWQHASTFDPYLTRRRREPNFVVLGVRYRWHCKLYQRPTLPCKRKRVTPIYCQLHLPLFPSRKNNLTSLVMSCAIAVPIKWKGQLISMDHIWDTSGHQSKLCPDCESNQDNVCTCKVKHGDEINPCHELIMHNSTKTRE